MAYETGSLDDTEDLIEKLFTFATGLTTTPWTQDRLDLSDKEASLHRGDVYVHFKWDTTIGKNIGLYQSLGYVSAGTALDSHTHDSGNGLATIAAVAPTTERRCAFYNAGPYTAYHFFAGEGSNPYIHVVVEEAPGIFRHAFGFGNINKFNNWTGGEYLYGMYWYDNASYVDRPMSGQHTLLLDGEHVTYGSTQATMHLEGIPNGPANHRWGLFQNGAVTGNDGDGNSRCQLYGCVRGGPWVRELSWIRASQLNSYKVLIPITVFYRDTADTPDELLMLGQMEDVAVVNIGNLSPGEEITVGSDTWKVFPWCRKQKLDAGTQESWHAGLAYKKITA